MKRILLCLVLLLLAIPIGIYAVEIEIDGVTYTEREDGWTVSATPEGAETLVLQTTIDGNQVDDFRAYSRAYGNGDFDGNFSSVKKLIFAEGGTTFPLYHLDGWDNLVAHHT